MIVPAPSPLHPSLTAVLVELVHGASDSCWVLNPQDRGLLASLESLTGEEASRPARLGGASVAAHVEHLRYGLELLNRWNQGTGENPFIGADYSASWRLGTVSDEEWVERWAALKAELERCESTLTTAQDLSAEQLTGLVAAVVHLAYHFGAMRQFTPPLRGPKAG